MKSSKTLLLSMSLSLLSLGCTPVGKAADGDDPGRWSCKPDDEKCRVIRIQKKMPTADNDGELLHLVKNATFMIIEVKSPVFELRPTGGQWMSAFMDLTLTWLPSEKLIPDDECLEEEAFKKAARTEPPDYAHFFGRMPNFHSEGIPPKGKTHYVLLYPIEGSTSDDRSFCVWIADDSGGLHNGAVHGEDD